MAECPPGHRPIQQTDLAVGKKVVYVSRDFTTPNISTVIVDFKIMLGNNLNLSVAHMKRVFVALAGVGAKAAGDSPQVGAEAAAGAAAVGALAAVGAAASAAGTTQTNS